MGASSSVSSRVWRTSPAMNCRNVSLMPWPSPAGKRLSLALPEAQVDVARVALALVELRHERERLALQERDLLGAVAVDDVVVGHPQRLLVAEVDLVLAEVALALGVLDEHARARHAEPDRAHDRLDHRRAEDRVVDVVGVGGPQVAPALGARRLVGLVEEDELELRARVGVPAALARRARAGGAAPAAARRRPASRRARAGRTAPSTVPSSHGMRRSVARSGMNTKSP